MESVTLANLPGKGELSNFVQKSTQPELFPLDNEVLIKVHYSTITIDDINSAEGTELGGIPMRKSPSFERPIAPGIELSGVVEKLGKNADKFKVGDIVFGTSGFPFPQYGAWSQFCCVKQNFLLPKPDYLSLKEAAAIAGSGMVCSSVF